MTFINAFTDSMGLSKLQNTHRVFISACNSLFSIIFCLVIDSSMNIGIIVLPSVFAREISCETYDEFMLCSLTKIK